MASNHVHVGSAIFDVAEEAEVTDHTAIDLYQWLREVCSTRLLQDPPIRLGGAGTVVQIDESLFRHKPIELYCRSN